MLCYIELGFIFQKSWATICKRLKISRCPTLHLTIMHWIRAKFATDFRGARGTIQSCSQFSVIIFDNSLDLLSLWCGQTCRRSVLHHLHPKITCVTQTYGFSTGRLKVTVAVLFNCTRSYIFNVGQVFVRHDYARLKSFINRYCSTLHQHNGGRVECDWREHNCQWYLIWLYRIQPASLCDKYVVSVR